jgi:hypothetical protein
MAEYEKKRFEESHNQGMDHPILVDDGSLFTRRRRDGERVGWQPGGGQYTLKVAPDRELILDLRPGPFYPHTPPPLSPFSKRSNS